MPGASNQLTEGQLPPEGITIHRVNKRVRQVDPLRRELLKVQAGLSVNDMVEEDDDATPA